jgi:UDP-N-acetylglucosamine transferase subunit ALG13
VIFVTVGNYKGFQRLVSAVEQLKRDGIIEDEVLLQVGNDAEYKSDVCKVIQFLPPNEFERKLHEAAVVISHGGAGSIIQALRAGKVPIVMPRRAKYHEHVDDHQFEGTQALGAEGRIILIHEVEELSAAIDSARRLAARPPPPAPLQMIDLVSRAIEDLLSRQR